MTDTVAACEHEPVSEIMDAAVAIKDATRVVTENQGFSLDFPTIRMVACWVAINIVIQAVLAQDWVVWVASWDAAVALVAVALADYFAVVAGVALVADLGTSTVERFRIPISPPTGWVDRAVKHQLTLIPTTRHVLPAIS